MQNSIKFTKLVITEQEIEIANSQGFQYAVITKEQVLGKAMVIALFSHIEYAQIFCDSFHNKKDLYIQKISEGI